MLFYRVLGRCYFCSVIQRDRRRPASSRTVEGDGILFRRPPCRKRPRFRNLIGERHPGIPVVPSPEFIPGPYHGRLSFDHSAGFNHRVGHKLAGVKDHLGHRLIAVLRGQGQAAVRHFRPVVKYKALAGSVNRIIRSGLPSGKGFMFRCFGRFRGNGHNIPQPIHSGIRDRSAPFSGIIHNADRNRSPVRRQRDGIVLVSARFIDPDDVPAGFILVAVLRRDAPAGSLIPAFPDIGKIPPFLSVPEHAALRIPSRQFIAGTLRGNQVTHGKLFIQVHGKDQGLRLVNLHILRTGIKMHLQTVMDPDRGQDQAVPVHKPAGKVGVDRHPVPLRIGVDPGQALRCPGREGVVRPCGRSKVLIIRKRSPVIDSIRP